MDNIYVGRLMALAKHLILLCVAIAGAAVAAPRAAQAQDSVPAGTVLPMRLDTPLSSRKSRPGEVITGRIMQDVPLESGLLIRSGARITGHVLDVSSAATGGHAKISLVFDAIKLHRSAIPVTTNLRALASPLEIDDAQLPLYGGDRGTPSTAYTTVQVGHDEVVYRGGGPVAHGDVVVGKPVYGGVLVTVSSAPDMPCRGAIEENNQPQAL